MRFAAAVVVGFVGWLGVSVLHIEGIWGFLMPVALGMIAGLIARRPIFIAALWLGMLAAYPAALTLGTIAFLGENWALYAVLCLLAAAAGFGASLALIVGFKRRRTA
jgi:hypothetical protein